MNGKTNQANSANVYQAANSSSDAWGAWSVTCTPPPPTTISAAGGTSTLSGKASRTGTRT